MALSFRPPDPMQFVSRHVAESWRDWEMSFSIFFEAAELSKKPRKTQVAILLNCAGPQAQKIFQRFKFSGVEDSQDDYKTVLKKFREYCEPRKNPIFNSYKFWQRDQQPGELFDNWVMDLRQLLDGCDYTDPDRHLRDKVVFGIHDPQVREKLIQHADLTLAKAIDICHAAEASKAHFTEMNDTSTHQINSIKRTSHYTRPPPTRSTPLNCRYCGTQHEPRQCPAFSKICRNCGKRNHFAAVCRSQPKQVHDIETQSQELQSDAVEVIHVGSINSVFNHRHTKMRADLHVQNDLSKVYSVTFKLDTGADANILPYKVYKKLNQSSLMKTKAILSAFGNHHVKPLGTTSLRVTNKHGKVFDFLFYVTDFCHIPILGEQACDWLDLVKRVDLCTSSTLALDQMTHEYADVFKGMGHYEKEYHIELNPDADGVIQHPRKIPYAIRPKLKAQLDILKEQGIVADVDGPTDWVSNLVIVYKKNNNLRLCLDPKPLNAVIRRERYNIPTPADVQAQLSGKKLFTVIDMKDGYWHVRLSDASSYLTTFHTPWGRMRFLRMPFGISSASEVMQKRNEETFSDIPGVYVIADDIIIAATDEEEHDRILRTVLDRARQKNVKCNLAKIQFKVPSVVYMGHLVSDDGLKPDERKVLAIVNMPQPSDASSLQRLLGMTKYLSQYIPNESTITAPLRELLKKNAAWNWTERQTQALDQLKAVLTSKPVLSFYDVNKPIVMQSDASQHGLGACLLQEGKPVAYASRSMSHAEVNYAQIEKEMLSIVFAAEKFHQYIFGKPAVTVETDHKPLESIMKKPLCKAPPRLQRLMLRLQRYDLRVRYVPGKEMYMADTLSRAYIQGEPDDELSEDLEYVVHALITSLPVTSAKWEEIRTDTANDEVLPKVIQYCLSGWPRSQRDVRGDARKFWNIRDELHIAEGILFANDRIVIPEKFKPYMLKCIHEGHFGMEKCKARARQICYWPGLSRAVEEMVAHCQTCKKFQRNHQREPLIPHDIPNERFLKVAMDIMTYQAKDYLVIVDYFSKYPEMLLLSDKTAATIVEQSKAVFARHGIPAEVVSDNMPFQSKDFLEFAKAWNIKTTTSSPGFPQSNGQAERTIQTMKNILKKAIDDGGDPYLAMLEYRNSPVTGLQYSPAQILMSRRLRSKLPVSTKMLEPHIVDIEAKLEQRQQMQKKYYDRGTKPLPELQKGDVVYYNRNRSRAQGIITNRRSEPRSYQLQNEYGDIRRNRRQLYKTVRAQPEFQFDYCEGNGNTRSFDNTMNTQVTRPCSFANDITDVRDANVQVSRSGRQIKPPSRYNEFVTA